MRNLAGSQGSIQQISHLFLLCLPSCWTKLLQRAVSADLGMAWTNYRTLAFMNHKWAVMGLLALQLRIIHNCWAMVYRGCALVFSACESISFGCWCWGRIDARSQLLIDLVRLVRDTAFKLESSVHLHTLCGVTFDIHRVGDCVWLILSFLSGRLHLDTILK